MDFKKTNAPVNTVTRNLMGFCKGTNNVYESVAIIGKRANQISVSMKEELSKKLQEFGTSNDEQIQISRYYERLPKPVLIATQEFLEDKIYYRNPAKEASDKLQ